ncbi:MAG: translation initiation factor IF-3 [Candidatus Peregrinibacteria bacterium]
MTKHLRRNDFIRAPQVLLIDGETKTVVSREDALKRAHEQELDLVEVAPMNNPPVCKIMDYGSYLYDLKKKEKKQRQASKQTETKTIRLSIRTGLHDLEVKARQARKFIEARHIVKVVVIFKGREITHGDLGTEKLNQFFTLLQDVAVMEQIPKRQGYQMLMILNPSK